MSPALAPDETSWRDALRSVSGVFLALTAVVVSGAIVRAGTPFLPQWDAILLWFGLLAIVSVFRWSWTPALCEVSPLTQGVVWFGTCALVVLAAFALSISDLSGVAMAVVWGLLGGHESLWAMRGWTELAWSPSMCDATEEVPKSVRPSVAEPTRGDATPETPRLAIAATDEGEESAADEDEVLATQTRSLRSGRVESIGGFVRATFASGERTKTVHIGFMPPLSRDPKVEWEQVDGEACSIRVEEARCFGLRIELRLARPAAGAASVAFEYAATTERVEAAGA